MLANYLIGLREGLEAGLIVGILVAYLGKIGRRDLLGRLWIGIAIAVAVSLGVGALLTWGPYAMTFQAQEMLGGVLSLVAVAMVTWMIFWMATHGAGLSKELRGQVDAAIDRRGSRSSCSASLAVGREGIETALFVWANVARAATTRCSARSARCSASLTAVVISWGISRGLVRFNLSVFFTWTGLFLILVAAGVLAYGIGDLQEASVIPGWAHHAFSLIGDHPARQLVRHAPRRHLQLHTRTHLGAGHRMARLRHRHDDALPRHAAPPARPAPPPRPRHRDLPARVTAPLRGPAEIQRTRPTHPTGAPMTRRALAASAAVTALALALTGCVANSDLRSAIARRHHR